MIGISKTTKKFDDGVSFVYFFRFQSYCEYLVQLLVRVLRHVALAYFLVHQVLLREVLDDIIRISQCCVTKNLHIGIDLSKLLYETIS